MDNAVRRKRLISLAIIISHKFLQSSLSVTNESDSDEEINNILMARHRRKLRGARKKPLRIEGYVERTVQGLTAKQFREHFRMIPDTYEILEAKLGLLLSKESDSGRAIIPVRKQLLSTLWLLATPDSYRSVGERFDMGKSSASDSFIRIVKALNDIAGDVIVWPRGDRRIAVQEMFHRIGKLPHTALLDLLDQWEIGVFFVIQICGRRFQPTSTLSGIPLDPRRLDASAQLTGFRSAVQPLRLARCHPRGMVVSASELRLSLLSNSYSVHNFFSFFITLQPTPRGLSATSTPLELILQAKAAAQMQARRKKIQTGEGARTKAEIKHLESRIHTSTPNPKHTKNKLDTSADSATTIAVESSESDEQDDQLIEQSQTTPEEDAEPTDSQTLKE
ncbi:hypothetical protein DBV15_12309 [Temnothorax longispinosus]|uniref:Nuclease HARBI1 n=1 Tax=Temnothorax longispinosus TaxID=300112 RepID=A0A4S2JM38_9HYME|nr:hypothetical protein DBV15_12309 [Temnothorax longispinosus]